MSLDDRLPTCADVICLNQAHGLYAVNCQRGRLLAVCEAPGALGCAHTAIACTVLEAALVDTDHPVTLIKVVAAPTGRLIAIVAPRLTLDEICDRAASEPAGDAPVFSDPAKLRGYLTRSLTQWTGKGKE